MAVSFKEYIEDKYFDYIYNKIKSYILDNKTSIPFKLKRINKIHLFELEDAYFKKFYVQDYLNDQIGMTIIIETQVTLKQYKSGEYIDDCDYPWFLVKCRCNFEEKITNFRITSVEYFEDLKKEPFGLTDNLIPYIKKEKLDSYAYIILEKIYPEALKGCSIDPYEFARRLNLTIKEKKFKNPNRMGAIYFEECKVKNNKGEFEIIPANTIIIRITNLWVLKSVKTLLLCMNVFIIYYIEEHSN